MEQIKYNETGIVASLVYDRANFTARVKALFRQRLLTFAEYKTILGAIGLDEDYSFNNKTVRQVLDEHDLKDLLFSKDKMKNESALSHIQESRATEVRHPLPKRRPHSATITEYKRHHSGSAPTDIESKIKEAFSKVSINSALKLKPKQSEEQVICELCGQVKYTSECICELDNHHF